MQIKMKRLHELNMGDYLLIRTTFNNVLPALKVLSIQRQNLVNSGRFDYKYTITFFNTENTEEFYEYKSPDEQHLLPVIVSDEAKITLLEPPKPALPKDKEQERQRFLRNLAASIVLAGGCLMYPEELEKESFSDILHICFNNNIKLDSSYQEKKNG